MNRRDPDAEPDLAGELVESQRSRMVLVRDAWRRSRGQARLTWGSSLHWFSMLDGCRDLLTDDELAELRGELRYTGPANCTPHEYLKFRRCG